MAHVGGRELDQLDLAPAAGDLHLVDEADAGGVGLLLDDLGLEGVPVLGHDDVVVGAQPDLEGRTHLQDLAHVLGLALVELLPVGIAHLRLGEHHDAGQGAVLAVLPRAVRR